MTAATLDRNTVARNADNFGFPIAANVRIFAGTIVCLDAAGNAVPGAAVAALKAVGLAAEAANNIGGPAGSILASVKRGCFLLANSAAADQLVAADYGATCYVVDDQTVAKTNGGGARPIAGVVRGVEPNGVWVQF
jgi:hypothetical protein